MPGLVIDATKNDLTYRIIGAAMAVHNAIGPGYKEELYDRALAVDLFVEDQVIVEIKAFSHQLTNDERAQVINYLKAVGAPVGLLFNFGRRRLEYARLFPGKAADSLVQRLGRDDGLKRDRGWE